jgi:hypothetical protein
VPKSFALSGLLGTVGGRQRDLHHPHRHPHFALHATNSEISGLQISPLENIPSNFTVQNQVSLGLLISIPPQFRVGPLNKSLHGLSQ